MESRRIGVAYDLADEPVPAGMTTVDSPLTTDTLPSEIAALAAWTESEITRLEEMIERCCHGR